MPPNTPPVDLSALVAGRPPSEREKQIWGTRIGIQVLILAVLLQWIPLIEYLGLMVGGIGVFYVIRGRRAFGLRHQRLVWASIILFVGTEVSAFALDQEFAYTLLVARYSYSGSDAASLAIAAYDGLAVGSSAVAVFLAVSYVLLAFDLEDRDGRRLLFAGVAAQVAVSVALVAWVLPPLIHSAVPQAFATTPPDGTVLAAVDAEIRGVSALRLLDSIPAILFAGAYARAYRRVERGGVPPPETTPA